MAENARRTSNIVLLCILLPAAYWITRLWNLRAFPLFIDEGVYLWYAENLLKGDLLRGFGEGKPLIGWLIALPYAMTDPTLSARLPHVLAGFVGMLAAAWLAGQLFDRRTALVSALLCISLPPLLFLERLATPDIVLGALGTLAMALSVAYYRRLHWWLALLAGAALVMAVLAKSPVGLFFLLPPVLLFVAERPRRYTLSWRNLAPLYALPLLFILLAGGMVFVRWRAGIQPIGFGLHEVIAKTGGEIDLLARLGENLPQVAHFAGAGISWIAAVLLIGSSIASIMAAEPALRALSATVWLWILAIMLSTTFWADRYLAPVLYCAAVVMAWGLVRGATAAVTLVQRRWSGAARQPMTDITLSVFLIVVIASLLPMNRLVLFEPTRSPIASPYLTAYGSGTGITAAAEYLQRVEAGADGRYQLIALHVSDYMRLRAGTPPSMHSHIRQVHIVDRQNQDFDGQVRHLRKWLDDTDRTYVVVESTWLWGEGWRQAFPEAELIASFEKPGGQDAGLVLRLR